MTWQALDPGARLLFHLQAAVRFVLFWVPATLVACGMLASTWSVLGAIACGTAWLFLQLLIAIWLPSLAYERWASALREDDLLVAHGVFFRSITAIPWHRIQHVDTRQGPVERLLGLARLQIYTASGMGADGVIPGLALQTAEALRDRLVQVSGDEGV
jgi:membrane protein YdbS with pleckstrin-like domain